MYEKSIENRIIKENLKSFVSTKFLIPYKEIIAKVGTDNKNEILAESYLLKLKNLAPVIVIPDLLTPGTNDKICIRPIKIAILIEKLFFNVFLFLNLSLT